MYIRGIQQTLKNMRFSFVMRIWRTTSFGMLAFFLMLVWHSDTQRHRIFDTPRSRAPTASIRASTASIYPAGLQPQARTHCFNFMPCREIVIGGSHSVHCSSSTSDNIHFQTTLSTSDTTLHVVFVFPATFEWPYPAFYDENNTVSASLDARKISVPVPQDTVKMLDVEDKLFIPRMRRSLPPNFDLPHFPGSNISMVTTILNVRRSPISNRTSLIIVKRHRVLGRSEKSKWFVSPRQI